MTPSVEDLREQIHIQETLIRKLWCINAKMARQIAWLRRELGADTLAAKPSPRELRLLQAEANFKRLGS